MMLDGCCSGHKADLVIVRTDGISCSRETVNGEGKSPYMNCDLSYVPHFNTESNALPFTVMGTSLYGLALEQFSIDLS